MHTTVVAACMPGCTGSTVWDEPLDLVYHMHNVLSGCRSKGAPEGRQQRPPAELKHSLRLRQLLSILKAWSSCFRNQPQPCCRQLPPMRQPGQSMPLHAGNCWGSHARALTSRMRRAGTPLQTLSRCTPPLDEPGISPMWTCASISDSVIIKQV